MLLFCKYHFQCIFFNEKVGILIKISYKFLLKGPIDNKLAFVQVMALHQIVASYYMNRCWPRSMTAYGISRPHWVNTLRPRQNGCHFADDTFNPIFVNENVRISIKFSLKFVPKGPINNIPALVQIMVWRRPGDKPLSEPVMVSLLTHMCVTLPQWVNILQTCVWLLEIQIVLGCPMLHLI